MARSKKILEGNLKELKRRSDNQLRLSADASLAEVARCRASSRSQPSTATSSSRSPPAPTGGRSCSARSSAHRVDAFSRKEPELEEIYLRAVRDAGLEETRDDRVRSA